MSELSKFPGLDDLASKIEQIARDHPDYSRAWEIVRVFCDHLRAVEALSRTRRKLHELEIAMEKKETPATVDEAIEQRMEEARDLPDFTISSSPSITIAQPMAPSFTFSGNDSKMLFTIRPDGTIERGPAFTTTDEASLKFWEIIEWLGMPVANKDQLALSRAYLRLRALIPGAFDTPHAPTPEQVWETTEKALKALLETRRVEDTPQMRSAVVHAIAHVREQNGWPPFSGWISGWIAIYGERKANPLTKELSEEAEAVIKAINKCRT